MRLKFLIPPTKDWHKQKLLRELTRYRLALEAIDVLDKIEGRTLEDRAQMLPEKYQSIPWGIYDSSWKYASYSVSRAAILKEIGSNAAQIEYVTTS